MVRESGLLVVITVEVAWRRISARELEASPPGAVGAVTLEAVMDADLGPILRIQDASGQDALGSFPIWDRARAAWVNPFRPDGPPLPGPGPKP